MKAAVRARPARESASNDPEPSPPLAPHRTLSAGWVAMVPLLGALEWVYSVEPQAPRNIGMRLMDLLLRPAGERVDHFRWAALALASAAALVVLLVRRAPVLRTLARIGLEGLGLALLLGPLLVALARGLEPWVGRIDVSWDPTSAPPSLVEVGLALGAGAWEELVFRVGAYSLAYLLALRAVSAFGAGERLARGLADLSGLVLSSLAFAAAHFAPVTTWLDLPAREFALDSFSWLCLGGLALGLIFRWRGPGVAAWAHALFNVALWIGIDPDVIW